MSNKTTKINDQFRVSKTEKVFALVKDEQGKVNITMGGYAVSSKKFDTYEQAERYIGTKPYELIINICATILTRKEKYEKESENNAENAENA